MYPNQDQQGQQHSQQYPPSSHSGARSAHPEYHSRPEYQDPSQPREHYSPNTMASMATYPSQHDMYRMSAHADPYRAPPQDPYRGPPPQHMAFNQPAPRQRTAIACRYCRRRKIRCSGFESSEDGRCSNCQRFHQECIFTPVSSQAQAFVPAHTAYPHLRNPNSGGRGRPGYGQNPPVIYGAHGQPLSTGSSGQGGYPREPGYPLPSPGAGGPSPSAPYARPYEEYSSDRRRGHEDSHSAGVPTPVPGSTGSAGSGRYAARHGSAGEQGYGDYQGRSGSPSSATSYHSAYPPSQQLTPNPQQAAYYSSEHQQTPPQSAYPYERGSHSPHGSTGSGGYPFPGGRSSSQGVPPSRPGGSTPSPSEQQQQQQREGSSRSGMSIQNMLDQGPGAQGPPGRSARDSEMLNALMPRRGM